MSGQDITVKLEIRETIGKGLGNLRRSGSVPAVIHDHGKESVHVMGNYTEMYKTYINAGKHHPVNITVGNKKYMALIKDADFEPRKHMLRHLVFNAIKADEKQQTEVPIKLVGEIPAEKAGLLVITPLDVVEIEALPKDLIDEIEVDASRLTEIGDKLTVADIKVPGSISLLTEPEHTIAVVEETPAQVSEEAEEAEQSEDANNGESAEKPAEAKENTEN